MPIYDTIKAQEANFPLPQPTAIVTVGTLNATTGMFQYAVPLYWQTITTQPQAGGGSTKPERERLSGGSVTAVNAFGVTLRFKVTGRQGAFSATVQGHPTVTATADTLDVDIAQASTASFTLACNGNSFACDLPLKIARPIAAAGALTIKALPISVVYAPPVDQQQRNVASWTGNDVTGTTTSVGFREQDTTTVPTQGQFESWLELGKEMKFASGLLSDSDNPYAKGIGKVLGVCADQLGTSTVTQGSGTVVVDNHTVTVTLSTQSTLETNPRGGGPGVADILFFLRNAQVCWYTNGGPMKLALLGWDAVDAITASTLQAPPAQFPVDAGTRAALLALDPFAAGGPAVALDKFRYELVTTFDVNATATYTVSYTLSSTDRTETEQSSYGMEDDSAQFLAWANIGVTQSLKGESVLTHSSASENTNATTITRQVQFFANPKEVYSVEVYCDVIFGTFAFRSVGSTATSRLGGRAIDQSGKSLPHTVITLTSQGRQFQTTTDADGNFAFHAATIGAGKAQLSTGATVQPIDVRATPTVNVELRRR
jgi:hypothetical protein